MAKSEHYLYGSPAWQQLIADINANNPELKHVVVNGGEKGKAGIEELFTALARNNQITHISIADEEISTKELLIWFDMIKEDSPIQSMTFENIEFTDDSCASLISSKVVAMKSLQHLVIKGCQLYNQDIETFLNSIEENDNILTVDFSDNNSEFDDRTMQAFCAMLSRRENLKKLVLANNNIGEQFPKFKEVLITHTGLKHLDLTGCNLGHEEAEDLAAIIKENSALEQLIVANNKFDVESAKHFGKAISGQETLKHLVFSGNPISALGLSHILAATLTNSKLEELELGSCNTERGELSIENLMEHAKKNETLRRLNLPDNNLNASGFIYLANYVMQLSKLEFFNIAGNPIGRTAMPTLGHILLKNRNLVSLNLSGASMDSDKLQELSVYLGGIQELIFDGNSLSVDGFHVIANIIRMGQLRRLSISDYGHFETGIITEAFSSNMSLQELVLQNCNLGIVDITLLFNELKGKGKFVALDLRVNPINDRIVKQMINLLRDNKFVKTLQYDQEQVSANLVAELDKLLVENNSTAENNNDAKELSVLKKQVEVPKSMFFSLEIKRKTISDLTSFSTPASDSREAKDIRQAKKQRMGKHAQDVSEAYDSDEYSSEEKSDSDPAYDSWGASC